MTDVLIEKGYLSGANNSVLVSSLDSKTYGAAANASKTIADKMTAKGIDPAIISQKTNGNSDIKGLSGQYKISEGKAALILGIVEKDNLQSVNNLANKNINQLNLIMSSKNIEVEDTVASGTPSQSGYIGYDKAKETAASDLGISVSAIRNFDIDIDTDRGVMVYEVEFHYNGSEYEYDINATDGKIIDKSSKPVKESEPIPSDAINASKARSIAYAHAGVSPSDVLYSDVDFDTDDGVYEYDVEFSTSVATYEYIVNGMTGEVISFQKTSINLPEPGGEKVTAAEAQSIALKAAGAPSDTKITKSKLEIDDGRAIYDIRFTYDSQKYEYEIDVLTGAVLSVDIKRVSSPSNVPEGLINESEALAYAYANAGVDAKDVIAYDVELKFGKSWNYEVEFSVNGLEYEYRIDANTGAVLKKTVDVDDNGYEGGNKPMEAVINLTAATDIVLKDAGFEKSQITDLDIDLSRSASGSVYEIDFRHGNVEYEYVLNAVSGAIIAKQTSQDNDIDDDDDNEVDD